MGAETDRAKGRVKQAAGDLTGDEETKREGKRDELAGQTKEKIDAARDKARDAVDSVKERMDD